MIDDPELALTFFVSCFGFDLKKKVPKAKGFLYTKTRKSKKYFRGRMFQKRTLIIVFVIVALGLP
jgi:hypothetical protein